MGDRQEAPLYLDSIGRYIGFAHGSCGRLCEKLLEPHGLSLQNWVILTALWRQDGLTIGQIAQYYHVKPPAASRILNRMAKDGWVHKKSDVTDKRTTFVFLTPKAKAKSHLVDFYQAANDHLTQGFSEQEQHQVRDLLSRMGANAQKALQKLG